MAGSASDLAGWSSGLAVWASGLAGWLASWAILQMENIPILQDSIPYPGRCPKPDDRWKKLFRGYEMKQTAIFYLFWFNTAFPKYILTFSL